jgi:signal peptidase I
LDLGYIHRVLYLLFCRKSYDLNKTTTGLVGDIITFSGSYIHIINMIINYRSINWILYLLVYRKSYYLGKNTTNFVVEIRIFSRSYIHIN